MRSTWKIGLVTGGVLLAGGLLVQQGLGATPSAPTIDSSARVGAAASSRTDQAPSPRRDDNGGRGNGERFTGGRDDDGRDSSRRDSSRRDDDRRAGGRDDADGVQQVNPDPQLDDNADADADGGEDDDGGGVSGDTGGDD